MSKNVTTLKPKAHNLAVEHVPPKVIGMLGTIAETRDSVATGPVRVFMLAGMDTILSWPSVIEERERGRKPGEVDWFRAEVDRSPWAMDIAQKIESLKAQPKNAVTDREIQTLRQRPSYAAGLLRKARAMASKMVECEGLGFNVTLPDEQALTRTTFPITVIDDARKGLPVQLAVGDFLNLRVIKGRKATELEVTGGRRAQRRRRIDPKTLSKTMEQGDKPNVAAVIGAVADYLDNNADEAAKSKAVVHELKHLKVSVGKALRATTPALAKAA